MVLYQYVPDKKTILWRADQHESNGQSSGVVAKRNEKKENNMKYLGFIAFELVPLSLWTESNIQSAVASAPRVNPDIWTTNA